MQTLLGKLDGMRVCAAERTKMGGSWELQGGGPFGMGVDELSEYNVKVGVRWTQALDELGDTPARSCLL